MSSICNLTYCPLLCKPVIMNIAKIGWPNVSTTLLSFSNDAKCVVVTEQIIFVSLLRVCKVTDNIRDCMEVSCLQKPHTQNKSDIIYNFSHCLKHNANIHSSFRNNTKKHAFGKNRTLDHNNGYYNSMIITWIKYQ